MPAAVVHQAALLQRLTDKAHDFAARYLGDPPGTVGELVLLRLRGTVAEMLVAPTPEATLVVLQRAHSASFVV